MATAPWWQTLDQQPPAGFGYPSWLAQYDQQPQTQAFADPFAQFQAAKADNDRRASAVGSTGLPGTGLDRTGGQAATAALSDPLSPGDKTPPGEWKWTIGVPGYTFNPATEQWVNPQAVAKYTWMSPGVAMPVDYDPTKDTYRQGVNGTQENAMQRAMRWAKDMINTGQTKSYQNALNFAMAQLSSDWQRGQAGQQPDWNPNFQLGWDPRAFRYNQYGEKYNDAIDYASPTKTFSGQGAVAPGQQQQPQAPAPAGQAQTGGGPVVQPNDPTNPYNTNPTRPPALPQLGQQASPYVTGVASVTDPQHPGQAIPMSSNPQQFGQYSVPDWASMVDAIQNDSSGKTGAQALRLAQGQTGRTKSKFGLARDDMYGKALYLWSILSGAGGNPDFANGGLQGFQSAMQNNNIIDFLHRGAGNVVNSDLSSLTDPESQALLNAAISARSVGQGRFGTAMNQSALADLIYGQDAATLGTNANDETGLGDLVSGSPFQRAFNQYLALSGQGQR